MGGGRYENSWFPPDGGESINFEQFPIFKHFETHLLSVAFTHVATLCDRRVFGLVFLRLGHTSRVRGVPLTAKFHAAIDTREDVAPPALGFVLLHLILLTVRAATRALEEDHVRRKWKEISHKQIWAYIKSPPPFLRLSKFTALLIKIEKRGTICNKFGF